MKTADEPLETIVGNESSGAVDAVERLKASIVGNYESAQASKEGLAINRFLLDAKQKIFRFDDIHPGEGEFREVESEMNECLASGIPQGVLLEALEDDLCLGLSIAIEERWRNNREVVPGVLRDSFTTIREAIEHARRLGLSNERLVSVLLPAKDEFLTKTLRSVTKELHLGTSAEHHHTRLSEVEELIDGCVNAGIPRSQIISVVAGNILSAVSNYLDKSGISNPRELENMRDRCLRLGINASDLPEALMTAKQGAGNERTSHTKKKTNFISRLFRSF